MAPDTEIYGPGIGILARLTTVCMFGKTSHVRRRPEDGRGAARRRGEKLFPHLIAAQQGAPLIRYRTHDLRASSPAPAPANTVAITPRIGFIVGRTRRHGEGEGCNMSRAHRGSHQLHGGHLVRVPDDDEAINGRDVIHALFETALTGEDCEKCERELEAIFKAKIGCSPRRRACPSASCRVARRRPSASSTAVTKG